ncbi:MAG: RNA polymerase sigma factor [Acidimicrobiia bacterium]
MGDCDHDPDAGGEWVDLREVVVEHHREIFRYARAFTFNDADAEDLAQTAVVRALQRGTIVSDAERAKAYVKRIVRNLATDQARVRARVSIEPRAQVPDGVADDDALDAVHDEHRDGGPAAQVAFAGLDPADREVLRLRYLEELAYRAVAERMHTTEHGARQRVYRAMQALRAALKNNGTPWP